MSISSHAILLARLATPTCNRDSPLATAPKIAIGAAIASLGALLLLLFLFWAGDEEPAPDSVFTEDDIQDISPPLDAHQLGWHDHEQPTALTLSVDGSTPQWSSDAGQPVMEGPLIDDASLEWSRHQVDQWELLTSTHRRDDNLITLHLWSHPGASAALLEVQTQAQWPSDESAEQPVLSFRAWPDELEALQEDGYLVGPDPTDIDAPIVGLRASFEDTAPLGMTWPAGPAARATYDDALHLSWPLGDTDPGDFGCDERPQTPREQRFAISLELGDAPLFSPSPAALSPHPSAAPIFIDAPRTSDSPWVDGRARTPEDMALRFRALAFGHSDREDPRYGNSGLLGADLRATFAVPSDWWDAPEIHSLRRSLEGRPIDVIPLLKDAALPPSTDMALFEDPCQALHHLVDSDYAIEHAIVLDDGRNTPRSIGWPLAPVTTLGLASGSRASLMDSLFGDSSTDLFGHSTTAAGLIFPIRATRNPLEEVWHQNLLKPERQGHWVPHPDLIQELTAWEFQRPSTPPVSASLPAIAQWRQQSAADRPWYSADNTLHIDALDAGDLLFGLGDLPSGERLGFKFPPQLRDLEPRDTPGSISLGTP